MEIDAAQPADTEAVREVARAAWRVDYPVTRETADETVAEWYDPERVQDAVEADDAVVLVARTDGEGGADAGGRRDVVGFTHAVVGPAEDEAAILRVYVHPDRRRAALGTRLIEATVERLREEGVDRVEAMVLADNDTGREFYRSLGFEYDRTEQTRIAGESHDERVYVCENER